MTRIVLDVEEHKVEPLVALLSDLPYVKMQVDDDLKVWDGSLKAINNPITVENFRR